MKTKRTASRAGRVLYSEDFAKGPGCWRVGKDDPAGPWHRNIFGQRGTPAPAGWEKQGARGVAISEGPWYFDDNHGELFWLYLAFFVNRSADAGLARADLRGATVDLTLRGPEFKPAGTRLHFWIQSRHPEHDGGVHNWCLTSQPIDGPLVASRWTDVRLTLANDESQWSQMGLLNGGLARRVRVIQSTSAADGTLADTLNGGHVNLGFLLCGVDPNDPPRGRLEFACVKFTGV